MDESALLRQFQEVTQEASAARARAMLQAHDWDLEGAIASHFAGGAPEPATSPAPAPVPAPPERPERPERPAERPEPESGAQSGALWPFSVVASVARAALAPVARVLNGEAAESPQRQAERFIAGFERDFPPSDSAALRFSPQAYRDAVRSAHDQGRFLFVYLHAPDHCDAPQFCRQTLCDEGVAALASDSFVVWGGDVTAPDAFQASMVLGATQFPFAALLACGANSVAIAELFEGPVAPDALLQRLTAAMAEHQGALDAGRAAHETRVAERELRADQDREYLEAVEADRRRAEEARAAREAEAAAAAAAEQAAAAAAAEEAAAAESLAAKRASLEPGGALAEPASGGARLRFNLPNGARADRRFAAEASIADVRVFVDVLLADAGLEAITNYELATNFPRRVFSEAGETVEAAGLVPQAVLFVQDLDS